MKTGIIILMAVMAVFLVPPYSSFNKGDSCSKCSSSMTKKKKEDKNNPCNPFVNCCYRTFEVSSSVKLDKAFTPANHQFQKALNSLETKDFSQSCWHPPRYVVS